MALVDLLRNLFAHTTVRGGRFIGVDIGSSAVKVVQLKREGGAAQLETYGTLALGVYGDTDVGRATQLPPERLAEALTDLGKEAGVSTPIVGAAIPYRASMITIVSLPDVGATQLAKMIPIEARKYIPVPIQEVQLDWFVIPEEQARLMAFASAEGGETPPETSQPPEQVEVLLAAIYKEVLERYHKALTLAKFVPRFYEIEAFSAMRAVSQVHKAPFAIVDIGAATTKFYAIELGLVRASHLLTRGGQDITLAISRSLGVAFPKAEWLKRTYGLVGGREQGAAEAQPASEAARLVVEQLLMEVGHAIAAYQKRYQRALEYVVLTGGGAQLKGIADLAAQTWGISVRRADPFAKVQAPAHLLPVLQEAGPEFATAVGLALRGVEELG